MQKQVKIATQRLPIDEWVKGLAAIPDREFTLEAVQDYILQHAVLAETLENISSSPRAITPAISFSRTMSSSA